MTTRKLWLAFIGVVVVSFAVLLYYGREIYREAPPVPDEVVTSNGEIVFTGQEIKDGQNVWQSIGGQQLGTVWGHGAYQAPDWTADWLHREAVFMLDQLAAESHGLKYDELTEEQQAALRVTLQRDLRTNTYDKDQNSITVSPLRKNAIESNSIYYAGLFTDDPDLDHLRDAYSIPLNSLKNNERVRQLNAFFFWASWACITNRPGKDITYTNNWPADNLVGNEPTGGMILWTGFSVILLLAGIGLMVWFYAVSKREEGVDAPSSYPLKDLGQTPSQRATLKYFWVVTLLILVQVLMGVITAHYGVEGQGFYGFPLSEWLPYSISRTCTCNLLYSGLLPHGLQQVCIMHLLSQGRSRNIKNWG